MSEVIQRTTVRCHRCQASHPARIETGGAGVFGFVECPHNREPVLLSRDPGLFQAIRARSRCLDDSPAWKAKPLIAILPITDTCNFRCPVCFAASEPRTAPRHLPLAEIVQRALEAKRRGAKTLSLSGGEPTLHPDLPRIIREIKSLGLRVYLVTNGFRLGTEPGLAARLRRAGLSKVKLQMDALDPAVHRQVRANDFVEEKKLAAKATVDAGLRLGTITTVTRLNLDEIGRITQFSLSFAPALNTIVFQAAAPVGRFDLDPGVLVDKEEILVRVIQAVPGASFADVWPLPQVLPWGMRLHPDCGVNLLLASIRGKLRPARELVDLPGLHQRLSGLRGSSWCARNVAPLLCILRSTVPGFRLAVLRALSGFLFAGRRDGLVVLGVGSFCATGFIDEARLSGCATAELRSGGGVSPCSCYGER